LLINVAWEMAGRATRQRELAGLQEAMAELGADRGLLLTERTEEEIKVPEGNIAVRPLWLWTLELESKEDPG
jgi:predicted AAA+ superfamily ATPase